MHILQVLKDNRPSFSFEFFPPKSPETSETLFESIKELIPLKPSFVSVTYGAGGSTRQLTHDLVVKLRNETDLTIVSHLTCIGSTQKEIIEILKRYEASGIENIMALRGDQPKEQVRSTPAAFTYASEFVSFIKKNFPKMGIGVAGFPEGHPTTPNRLREMDFLKAKVDAGADYICTQLFFDNRDYYDFCERCAIAGISVPIIAGIMPITTLKGLLHISELALGVHFPAKLLRALSRAENDNDVGKIGIHWATEQVRDLIDNNARGIHFYTLNKSKATVRIYETLGVRDSDKLRGSAANAFTTIRSGF